MNCTAVMPGFSRIYLSRDRINHGKDGEDTSKYGRTPLSHHFAAAEGRERTGLSEDPAQQGSQRVDSE